MVKQIFVNLPVKDLQKSKAFWQSLGFSFDSRFSDEKGAGLALGENIFVMLLTEPFFQTFTSKTIAPSASSVEVLNAISVGSRAEVDALVEKAIALGGKEPRAMQDHGWMYNRAFEDIDGHTWEPVWMDLAKFPGAAAATTAAQTPASNNDIIINQH